MLIHPAENLPEVFGSPVPNIPDLERREVAYVLLLWACLYFGSRVKKMLGLKTGHGTGRSKKVEVMTKRLVGVRLGIPNESHNRLNDALQRIAGDLRGRAMESVVLPLELIQHFRLSDFPSQQEYEDCLRRNFKVIEAGLLLYPHADTSEGHKRINSMMKVACENPIAFRGSRESMLTFRRAVMSRDSRASNESGCHWTKRFPMNLWFYQTLLGACFEVREKTFVVEDVDEILELFQRTWDMLGIDEMVHSICFSWVLFRQYVTTGLVENDLLAASCNLLAKVQNNTKAEEDPLYKKAVNSALSLISFWTDKKLLSYHDDFHEYNMDSMEGIISLAILSAEILVGCNPKRKETAVAGTRVKNHLKSYIRTSLHAALAKVSEELSPRKRPSRTQDEVLLYLSALVQEITDMAFFEKEKFSPKLRRWQPLAAGVAAATLHEFYGNELKKSVERVTELTPHAIEVLQAADKLEKDLNKMAEEDSIDSKDGGKHIEAAMQPYKAKDVLAKLVKSWTDERVKEMEWFAKVLQREANEGLNEEGCFPSAVDVLKVINDTVEKFFALTIPMDADFLPDLMSSLDKSLQQYILKVTSGYGKRDTFIPAKPALTRCSAGHGATQKKGKLLQSDHRSKAPVGTTSADDSYDITQLCVRINTLAKICQELKDLEKQILGKPSSSNSAAVSLKFELSSDAASGGILQLCECIGYKVVFQDLRRVLLDRLYIGQVSSSRIEPFLEELKEHLDIISLTPVRDKVKETIFIVVMQASFDAFLFVLLAGGPSRAFSPQDYTIIEQDFKSLADLFRFIGNGFRSEFVEELSTTVTDVLPFFRMKTKHIIQRLIQLLGGLYDSSVKSGHSLPPASDKWSPEEPDTLLRVLCYRNEKAASSFLKRFSLPKNV